MTLEKKIHTKIYNAVFLKAVNSVPMSLISQKQLEIPTFLHKICYRKTLSL